MVPSKLTHLARLTFCTDSDLVTGFLERADGMCYEMLRDMAGNYPPASGPQLDILAYLAQQPRATGGLGLCHQAHSAPAPSWALSPEFCSARPSCRHRYGAARPGP